MLNYHAQLGTSLSLKKLARPQITFQEAIIQNTLLPTFQKSY